MWRYALIIAVCLVPLSPLHFSFHPQYTAGTLTVIVHGLENDRGSVRIALSNSEENYYDYPNPTIGATAPIRNRIAEWQFRDLPFGAYAIKVFHDENDDGELDTNFLGIPVEDYGFSNDVSGLFGPPGWDDTHFRFESDSMTVRISVD